MPMKTRRCLKALGVMGIPTMIGYKAGTQVARRTGAMQIDGIRAFFEAVEKGEAPQTKLSSFDRVIRLVIALAFFVLGTVNGITLLATGNWRHCLIQRYLRPLPDLQGNCPQEIKSLFKLKLSVYWWSEKSSPE